MRYRLISLFTVMTALAVVLAVWRAMPGYVAALMELAYGLGAMLTSIEVGRLVCIACQDSWTDDGQDRLARSSWQVALLTCGSVLLGLAAAGLTAIAGLVIGALILMAADR